MSSRLVVNSVRHTGASADGITLDSSGNVTFPANATCSGTATGFGKFTKYAVTVSYTHLTLPTTSFV